MTNVIALNAASSSEFTSLNASSSLTPANKPTKMVAADVAFGRGGNLYTPNPFEVLVDEGWNERDYEAADTKAAILRYAISIYHVGLKQPLKGYRRKPDGRFVATDGHLRPKAIYMLRDGFEAEVEVDGKMVKKFLQLELEKVEVKIEKGNDVDHLLTQIDSEGLQKTPLQKARIMHRLITKGLNEKDIANRLGINKTEVVRLLTLLELPQAMQNLISKNQISVSLAKELIDTHGEQQAVEIATQKIEEKTQEVVAKEAAKATKPAAKAGKAAPVADKSVDNHPALAAEKVKPTIRLTRQTVTDAPKANLNLARQYVGLGLIAVNDDNVVIDREKFANLIKALGMDPAVVLKVDA